MLVLLQSVRLGGSVCMGSYSRFRCEREACKSWEDDSGETHDVDRF